MPTSSFLSADLNAQPSAQPSAQPNAQPNAQPSENLSAEALHQARQLLQGKVHQTPVIHSQSLNQLLGCELFFKCENLQRVGAFKFRGASHVLALLSEAERAKGVVTHSSGNHAQALALAAQQYRIPCWVVMPNNSPEVKQAAVAGYGAEIITCEPTLQARESTAQAVIEKTGATFVHPYDDPRIIAGQSTAAQELFAQVSDLQHLLAPVGGGGLLSGSALAAHYFAPTVKVWGAEPLGADDAARSLQAGRLLPSEAPQTIADGLLTSLGEWTFPLIQQHVHQILTVSESIILQAMRLLFERLKTVVEPSGAVPLAAVLSHPEHFQGQRLGLIISGGNIDLRRLGQWFGDER